MTSPEYPAAMGGYCIRFWYNMYGSDIRSFNVYAKIASAGSGYPIFSMTGAQNQMWHMAEVDLDSEYTSKPFQLRFDATSDAYRSSYSSTSLLHTSGDIAFDDVYVYNTSCKNIPLCSPNGITRDVNGHTTCYTFHVQPATWYEAADACRHEGATTALVAVTSQDEQDFLVNTIKADQALTTAGQYGFYTAGADQRSEKTFDWTDTGTPYTSTYSNWKTGQPNDVGSDQDCLLLEYPDLDFQWGDVDCDSRHPFICETSYPTPKASAATASPMVGK
nr:hypothetical protein BaRGS_002123 [Batillaria attramentaria]